MEVKLYQYPRGANKGGILQGDICPTISTSSWENNCLLIECNMDGLKQNHNKRLNQLLKDKGRELEDKRFLDAYNQAISKEVSMTITARVNDGNKFIAEKIAIPQATKQGYIEVEPGGVFDAAYPESTTRRGRVQEGGKIAPTLCTSNELNLYEGVKNGDFRIRKLTPRECFRLMDVSEENIDKIQAAGISNTQQYKLAGNSIVVDVLYYIFKNLLCTTSDHINQTLFSAQDSH